MQIIGGFENSYQVFLGGLSLISIALLRYAKQIYHEMLYEVWGIELRALNPRRYRVVQVQSADTR